jgi:hypothetical protein
MSIFETISKAHAIIYLPDAYSIMLLEVCYRCQADVGITYACEHTKERKMCTECYEFIHWAINNKKDDIAKAQ